MSWRLAQSLETLREQIDEAWPNRSKLSDGTIGDPRHSPLSSDHNPDASNVVRAIDITHDPAHGVDCADITKALVESQDVRIKYIIWRGQIVSGNLGPHPWSWRIYTGSNPHDKHFHLSVVADTRADRDALWQIGEWSDMASEAEIRKIVKEEVREAVKQLAVGKSQEGWNSDKVNLKAVLDKKP